MQDETLRRIADGATIREVRAAAATIMPLLEEALADAQQLGIHAASIQEWSLAKFGKPLCELPARDAGAAVMHVNKLIMQKKRLMEAQSEWADSQTSMRGL